MPTTLKPNYATSAALTLTLASLATSTTRTAGRESTSVDNSSDLYDDVLVSGKITTGTSPTDAKQIDIWVYAGDGNDVFPDVLDGTDSDETITSENVRNASLMLLTSIRIDNTSDRTYFFRGLSVAALFGGNMPKKWGIFVSHDTGVNLNATGGNHEIRMMGLHYRIVAS